MKQFTFLCLSIFLSISAFSNNIQINNVSLAGQNTTDAYTLVQFDLSWENSWRISVGPNNWDAAWVFAKYRVNGNEWQHATINLTGNTAPAGATLDLPPDQTGAFIYRNADGTGDVNWTAAQLRWNYGADGVDDNALVDIQVFAIEMVYVPQGNFRVGTGNLNGSTEVGELYSPGVFGFQSPYEIDSELQINISSALGDLYYSNSTGNPGDQLGPIPAGFPKGFAAFYCMKYETSQDQWVGFFNTLTQTQKENLDLTGATGKNTDGEVARNAVSWPDAGSATTTLSNVSVAYVDNILVLAYLDWAGLRPMTELEYEKSCRGPLNPVPDEFAWGTSNIHATAYTISQEGTPSEIITDPGSGAGNVRYSGTAGVPVGPLRCGVFAASALLNNREETGGSYYGIMELTGNLYERAVSVGIPEGRAFTGLHGDGSITTNGAHNVVNWPLGTGEGIGYRGGSYVNGSDFIRVSDRNDAATVITNGNSRLGFRGVRTAE